jgi:Mrp family chromosome partitioning ATPase
VLPRLPGNPTRWKTAAPAAYRLHRLRTVLQTGPDSADRRVLAVTSPASGDGKTSLVLGLGLSFAAAGVRTLPVDLDFVNRDLSARVDRFRRRRLGELLPETNRIDAPTLDDALRQSAAAGRRLGETLTAMGRITPAELDTALSRQKEAAVGLPEVLAGASVGECAADAGVANLWELPLPPGSAGLSSSAMPAMLRRVMDQAADGFDMVLIDTGPLTGSPEAMPACRAADGVLLIAGRGAGRPAVAERLSQLRRMGCTVVGSVFNRARRSELSWIRRTPMFRRGRPAGPAGPDLKPWGPLAQAVAATATPWGAVRPLRPCLPAAGA